MNVHVADSRVKVAILTQYRRVGSSVIHLGCVYTACDLESIKSSDIGVGHSPGALIS